MGKIGTFGSLSFVVSDKTVRTFQELQWDISAKYATHDRHLKRDLLEFLGPETEGISLPIKFSVFLGTNPLKEIEKLRETAETGRAERLVLGGHVYGSYKWVITKISAKMTTYDSRGNCWAAQVTLTLKEYPRR